VFRTGLRSERYWLQEFIATAPPSLSQSPTPQLTISIGGGLMRARA
jgi:hypothetical protein